MGQRRIRREQRQTDQAASRLRNGIVKVKEKVRRDSRLLDAVKKGNLPYLPHVMSWLSEQLDKPSRLITPDDIKQLTKT